MTESAVIILSLHWRRPEAKVIPAEDSGDYLQTLRWLVFAATEGYPERFVTDS